MHITSLVGPNVRNQGPRGLYQTIHQFIPSAKPLVFRRLTSMGRLPFRDPELSPGQRLATIAALLGPGLGSPT